MVDKIFCLEFVFRNPNGVYKGPAVCSVAIKVEFLLQLLCLHTQLSTYIR